MNLMFESNQNRRFLPDTMNSIKCLKVSNHDESTMHYEDI